MINIKFVSFLPVFNSDNTRPNLLLKTAYQSKLKLWSLARFTALLGKATSLEFDFVAFPRNKKKFFFSFCFVVVKCQKLSLGSGVRVSPSHCLSSNQGHGSTCTFSCARGYQLSGPSSTQCGKGGVWSQKVNSVRCKGLYRFFDNKLKLA